MASEAELTRRLSELERRIDFLFSHLNLADPEVPREMKLGPGVQALLDRGDKLAAMSLVHEQTGVGLAEARRTVEQMMGGS